MVPSNVVITGAGLASPLGLTREATFDAVLQGRCGIARMTAIECELPPDRDGGEVPELPDDYEPALPREARYLHKTIRDALLDAGLLGSIRYPASRCGMVLGTTLHGMRAAGSFLRGGDFADLSRFLSVQVNHAAAGDLALGGFNATTCSACSSSLGSIALGVTLLESGEFDLVIAGGYDPVSEYAYAGFNSLRLVAEGPLRPFAKGRVGMKLSEGYGIVVLERMNDARTRGAKPLARIAGFGESADAHHLTQPHPQGEGASRAMQQAIASAGLQPTDIDLLVAHATGTPDNDASEYAAMSRVFGDQLSRIPCVAFKSHLGHTLGGAGAVELILSAMALERQMVPPCANVTPADCEFPGLNLVTGKALSTRLRASLSTSLGFGGANTSVVLVPPEPLTQQPAAATPAGDERDVMITGIGVVLPGAIGAGQFLQLLAQPQPAIGAGVSPLTEEMIAPHLINARRARRLSDYVKLLLAGSSLALADAGVEDVPAFAAECCAILGTMHGSAGYSESYYRQIVQEGVFAANPMLFAEGVPNAGSAHVSLMLGIKGACQTIIGSRTAGLDALALAAHRIRTGRWDRAIVGAAEEDSPLMHEAYAHCGLAGRSTSGTPFGKPEGFVSSSGSVVLVLESRRSAAARGARMRGIVRQVLSRDAAAELAPRTVHEVLAAIGCPRSLVTSADASRIDSAELAGITHACREGECGPATLGSLYGHLPEVFSVTPLAGLAAVLLSGRIPRLWGTPDLHGATASAGSENVSDFGVLCTDFSGAVAGARVERLNGGQA